MRKESVAFALMATLNVIVLIGGLFNPINLLLGVMMLNITNITRKERKL